MDDLDRKLFLTNVQMADFVLTKQNISLYVEKTYSTHLGHRDIASIRNIMQLSAILRRTDINTRLIIAGYPLMSKSDVLLYTKTDHNRWDSVKPK